MKKQKKEKKISIYDIEKQDIKLDSLDRHFKYLKYALDDLKERFNEEYKLYQESLDKLEAEEKKDKEMPQYKKDVKRMNSLEKKKKETILKLEHFRSEHQSIKQTLDEYEEKKRKFKEKCNLLQKENDRLKREEEIIDTNINEAMTEKKGLEERLEEKIRDEVELRQFYENEYKKYKEKKNEFIPPKKNFDLLQNVNGMNNNMNNNNLYDLNLSNVEENPENKKEDNSIISDNMNIKSIKSFEDKSNSQINNKIIQQDIIKNNNEENNNKINMSENSDNLYSSKIE